eukprot:scaffold394904_cov43-Prasinocladus_malaysianus.AAC.2
MTESAWLSPCPHPNTTECRQFGHTHRYRRPNRLQAGVGHADAERRRVAGCVGPPVYPPEVQPERQGRDCACGRRCRPSIVMKSTLNGLKQCMYPPCLG